MTEPEITVTIDRDSYVATVTIHRPPNNFIDAPLLRALVQHFATLDEDPGCRSIVLLTEGKNFCAGRDFSRQRRDRDSPSDLYAAAVALLQRRTPWVTGVQGAAVGGGLGLALSADFRIGTPSSSFSANFARIGLHQGFGLTVLLPQVIGVQTATEMLYTGERIYGQRAFDAGLLDRLVSEELLATEAHDFAARLAAAAPLAVRAIRSTMRRGLAERVAEAMRVETAEQERLRATDDFQEGTSATKESRRPRFTGT